MNKNFICGVVGFILGGVFGYGVARHALHKDYEERLDALKAENKRLAEGRDVSVERHAPDEEADEDALSADDIPSPTLTDEDFEEKTVRQAYRKLVRKYSEDSAENFDAEHDAYKEVRMVPEQYFKENIDYMDCLQLTYYQGNGVLVDQNNDIVTAVENDDLMESGAMDILGTTKNDTVYVVNEPDEQLYEIMVEHNENFIRDVLW